MRNILWILTLLGALGGGLTLLGVTFSANGAPQQAAGAAMAAALAVIPYCLARAFSELGATNTEKLLAEINRRLANQGKPETPEPQTP